MKAVLTTIFVSAFLMAAVLAGNFVYADQGSAPVAVTNAVVPEPVPVGIPAKAPPAAAPVAATPPVAVPTTPTAATSAAVAPAASVPVDPNAVVENGKTVSFDYWLTVDGKEIENSEKLGPVEYVQGKGDVIPGLEKNLVGMKAGQEKSFKVSVEDGYGKIDPKAVQEVPKTLIPANVELKVGALLQMNDDKGNVFPATVMEINGDKVKLDFNHPLAGKELDFKVKIVSVK